jgi:hypothetical protein
MYNLTNPAVSDEPWSTTDPISEFGTPDLQIIGLSALYNLLDPTISAHLLATVETWGTTSYPLTLAIYYLRDRYDAARQTITPMNLASLLSYRTYMTNEGLWDSDGVYPDFATNLRTYEQKLATHDIPMPDAFFIGISFDWLRTFSPAYPPIAYAFSTIQEHVTRTASARSFTSSSTVTLQAIDLLLRGADTLHKYDNIRKAAGVDPKHDAEAKVASSARALADRFAEWVNEGNQGPPPTLLDSTAPITAKRIAAELGNGGGPFKDVVDLHTILATATTTDPSHVPFTRSTLDDMISACISNYSPPLVDPAPDSAPVFSAIHDPAALSAEIKALRAVLIAQGPGGKGPGGGGDRKKKTIKNAIECTSCLRDLSKSRRHHWYDCQTDTAVHPPNDPTNKTYPTTGSTQDVRRRAYDKMRTKTINAATHVDAPPAADTATAAAAAAPPLDFDEEGFDDAFGPPLHYGNALTIAMDESKSTAVEDAESKATAACPFPVPSTHTPAHAPAATNHLEFDSASEPDSPDDDPAWRDTDQYRAYLAGTATSTATRTPTTAAASKLTPTTSTEYTPVAPDAPGTQQQNITDENGIDRTRHRRFPSPLRALVQVALTMVSPVFIFMVFAMIFASMSGADASPITCSFCQHDPPSNSPEVTVTMPSTLSTPASPAAGSVSHTTFKPPPFDFFANAFATEEPPAPLLSPACLQRTTKNTPTRITKHWSTLDPSSARCNMQSDSGASVTIINNINFFCHGVRDVPPLRISTATGAGLILNKGGTAVLVTVDEDNKTAIIERHTAYYAPSFPVSLIAEGDLKNDVATVITKTASYLNADRIRRTDRHNVTQNIPMYDDANCSWLEILSPTSSGALAAVKEFYCRSHNIKSWNDCLHGRSSGLCRPASIDTPAVPPVPPATPGPHPVFPQWTPHTARLQSPTDTVEAHRLRVHYRRNLIHRNTPSRSRTLAEAHMINHFGDDNNKRLPGQSTGRNITTKSRPPCATCDACTPRRGSVPQHSCNPREVVPSRKISIDHCGPFKTGIGGYKYILRASCSATKFVISAPTRSCGAAETALVMSYFLRQLRKHGHVVEEILSDGHKTFRSADWERWCALHQIDFSHTPPYAHNQNPVERSHRDLAGDIRSALNAAHFPLSMWPLFVQGCDHLRNTECVRAATGMTAHEARTGILPNIYHHLPLGSSAIYIHPRERQHNAAQSFDIRGFNTYLTGYRNGGYLLFCPTSGQTIEAAYCDTTVTPLWKPRSSVPADLAKYQWIDPDRSTLRSVLRPVGHSTVRLELLDTIRLTPAELRARTHAAHRNANNKSLVGQPREKSLKSRIMPTPADTTAVHHPPADGTAAHQLDPRVTPIPGRCPSGHPMRWFTPASDNLNGTCDGPCRHPLGDQIAARCDRCDYDRCVACSPNSSGESSPSLPPPVPATPTRSSPPSTQPAPATSTRTSPSLPTPSSASAPSTSASAPPTRTPPPPSPPPPLGLFFNDLGNRRSTRHTAHSATADLNDVTEPIFPTCSSTGTPVDTTTNAPPSRFAHRSSPLTCINKDSLAMPSKSKSDNYLFNAADTIRLLHDRHTAFEAWASTVNSNRIAACINSSILRDPDYPSQGWALNANNPDRPSWLAATLAEIKTLADAGAIEAIPLKNIPYGTNIMRSLFVYRRKRDAEGNPIKDKARLVCDGSSSTSDDSTFSPTCQLSTVKLLSAFAVHNATLQHQTDISAAYIQAPIHRPDIYMRLPRNLDLIRDANGDQLALHIHKSLYGHPVSGKNWWDLISGWATKHGFTFSKGDPCLWTLRKGDKWIALSIFVDDMSACSNDPDFLLSHFITPLTASFPARYEGAATWTLGTAIRQAASPTVSNLDKLSAADGTLKTSHLAPIVNKPFTTHLSNKQKLVDLLLLTSMTDANPSDTPMVEGVDKQLSANPHAKSATASAPPPPPTPAEAAQLASLEDQFQYAHTVAALAFIARATRPDFVFAANLLARFMGNPQVAHYAALKRLLRYIVGTLDYGLTYTQDGDDTVRHYCDAAHQDDVDTRHSTLGYVTTWKGAAIAYHSRKSVRASGSSAESELYGLHSATKSVLALAKDLRHLNITAPLDDGSPPAGADIDSLPSPTSPQTIYVDNQATVTNVTNRYQYSRLRHIDASFMMVHERVHEGHISLAHIAGTDNPADLFTKALPKKAFQRHRFTVMGM